MNGIQTRISSGEILEAIELMLAECNSESDKNTLYNLMAQHHQNEKSNRLGLLSSQDYNRNRNRLSHSLLEISQDLGLMTSSVTVVTSVNKDYFSKVTVLQDLKKKVRFGFSKELKESLNELLNRFLTYEDQSRRDELFDIDEKLITKLNQDYASFIESHQRELRTKNAVKVAALKKQLNELEENLTVAGCQAIVDNLIALDIKHSSLKQSIRSLNESNIENFAYQLAEIIDNL